MSEFVSSLRKSAFCVLGPVGPSRLLMFQELTDRLPELPPFLRRFLFGLVVIISVITIPCCAAISSVQPLFDVKAQLFCTIFVDVQPVVMVEIRHIFSIPGSKTVVEYREESLSVS